MEVKLRNKTLIIKQEQIVKTSDRIYKLIKNKIILGIALALKKISQRHSKINRIMMLTIKNSSKLRSPSLLKLILMRIKVKIMLKFMRKSSKKINLEKFRRSHM